MNKATLVDEVAEVIKTEPVWKAKKIIDLIFDTIKLSVSQGEKVHIAGFGIFYAKDRSARSGRNPKTGEIVQVQATRTPKFRAGEGFKRAMKA